MNLRIGVLAALPLLLSGCVILKTYAPAAGEEMVTIDVAQLPSPAFCVDGVGYKGKPAGPDAISVPANRRLSLYSSFYASDGYMTWTCTAGAAYTFATGSHLVAALETTSNGCRVDLVQLNDSTQTGVAAEPSLGPALCNPWSPPASPTAVDPAAVKSGKY